MFMYTDNQLPNHFSQIYPITEIHGLSTMSGHLSQLIMSIVHTTCNTGSLNLHVSGGVAASTFSTTTPELEDAIPALFFTFLRLTFRLLVAGEDFVVLLGGNDVLTAKFGTPPREDKDLRLVATRALPSGIALERIWRWDCIEPAVSGCLCTDLLVPYPCLVCSMAVRSTVYGNRLEQVAKLTLVSPLW